MITITKIRYKKDGSRVPSGGNTEFAMMVEINKLLDQHGYTAKISGGNVKR